MKTVILKYKNIWLQAQSVYIMKGFQDQVVIMFGTSPQLDEKVSEKHNYTKSFKGRCLFVLSYFIMRDLILHLIT